ncbi:MAG: class I SAM-dependent methyltransferase [Betaproteobacteria bacterium]|nr:class I SAM-dependent methyltransferase [Betaproteobacteria bacterium]
MTATIPPEDIKTYYDRLAVDYDTNRFGNSYGRFLDRQERRVLKRWLTRGERERTLDLACGTGRLLAHAGQGCDLSAAMLAEATRKAPETLLWQGDGCALPLRDGVLQTVFSFHLIMHLPPETLSRIGREVWRVLEPGGTWIVDFPSARRRSFGRRADTPGWHGNSAYSCASLLQRLPPFELTKRTGLLFLPVHRVPQRIRPLLHPVDTLCCRLAPSWASYMAVCLRKPSSP